MEGLEKLQAQLDEQKSVIAEQNAKIEALLELGTKTQTVINAKPEAAPTVPDQPIKIGKDSYKWNVAIFQMPGSTEQFTAEAASTDKDLLDKILKLEGQGLLTKQA